jgi:allantoate deiminase
VAADTTTRGATRAETLLARCDALAAFTTEPGRITRPYGTAALREARDAVAGWMRDAGMDVRLDAIGNLRGRYPGLDPAAPALLLGSHLDSVRDAGRYDGLLGVLVGLAAVERLAEVGRRLPFPLEVVAFADEEGLRFQATYLGSRALAGTFDPSLLALVDDEGVTLRDAIGACGGIPEDVATCALGPDEAFAYVEVHIEQGPRLEAVNAPVGVVIGIAGQSRATITFRGEAGHAGTVAMDLRKDALPAAAELVLAVEAIGRETPELVSTVGLLDVAPGASNVIPGVVRLTLDVRHPDDTVRERTVASLCARAREIATGRGLGLDWTVVQENPAVPCDVALIGTLERAVADGGFPVIRLASGAGHDGVAMAAVLPIAMLFVRCAGGVSHNPAESVAAADVAAAVETLDRFLELLGEKCA